MTAIFVHLSDIHFGQERDDRVHIHADVKKQLVADAAEVVRLLPGGVAHAILVTGDIAFSGVREQYEAAGEWLDRLAEAVGCATHRIQMVPGNHDFDRQRVSTGAGHLLNDIRKGGAVVYEKILANDMDRASLFARFGDYAKFCEGYDCPLDTEGRYSTNLHVELAPGRAIRFVRMNSSLLCTGDENEKDPELLIGARQFTVDRCVGEEIVVLIHHPFHWLKDNDDATRYIKSRARVVISGHEHTPNVQVETIETGTDLLMLAAGATVPFKSDEIYTFTYNVLEFDWNREHDALSLTIHPRAWNPERTCFEADGKRLGRSDPCFTLGSPNFRKAPAASPNAASSRPEVETPDEVQLVVEIVPALDSEGEPAMAPEAEGYRPVLLRFFRDLTEAERVRILVELDALETASDEPLTQAVQRKLLDWLVRKGRVQEVRKRMSDLISNRQEGPA